MRRSAAPSAMIRVAQVTTAPAGIRFLLLDHIERLQQEGYEVEAVCGEDQFLPDLVARGITVRTVPIVREPSPVADLRATFALRSLFASRRYDVVHTHRPKAGLLGPLAARLAGTPLILHTIHGLLFHDRSPLPNVALGAACEDLDGKICAPSALAEPRRHGPVRRLRMCSPGRIHYIGNGIDVRRFSRDAVGDARARLRRELGFDDDHVVVGIVGRLVGEKGFEEFFEALVAVSAAFPQVRALIVGPPDEGSTGWPGFGGVPASLGPLRNQTWKETFCSWTRKIPIPKPKRR